VDTVKMEKAKSLISVLELRRLLITIVDYNLPVGFRYRMLGEMWQPGFSRVAKVTEKGVILNDDSKNKSCIISDLSQIIQFEVDGRIHTFDPNFHYDVTVKELLS
jgi:hypothetical protein